MFSWLALIISLPTGNAAVRMRAWRALKGSGAAVLRDGVYLMPGDERGGALLEAVATAVREGGGTAQVLRVMEPAGADFAGLFDRSADYAALLAETAEAHAGLARGTAVEALRQVRKLRKAFVAIADIDFFPGAARQQAEAAVQALELASAQLLDPGEPQPVAATLARLSAGDYRGRTWATRRRPWVDRLACAWLIRRFIDADARLLWLESPADCPPEALGFDFDGATFSHVGARVTFEVLLARFGLEQPALRQLGMLVHFLDVGGVEPPEAAGVESVLGGLRDAIADDDQLLASASGVFDGLLTAFNRGGPMP